MENLTNEPGLGFTGWVQNNRVLVGNRELMRKHGVDIPSRDYESRYTRGGRELVYLAVSAGDHKAFKAASGVGPKLAQRIVLELKDKVAKGAAGSAVLEDLSGVSAATGGQTGAQAIAALVSLGYSQSEAAVAISKIDPALPVEEIIRLALRGMAGGR